MTMAMTGRPASNLATTVPQPILQSQQFNSTYTKLYNRMSGSAVVRAHNQAPPFQPNVTPGKHIPKSAANVTRSANKNNPAGRAFNKSQNYQGRHALDYIQPGQVPPGLPVGSIYSVGSKPRQVYQGPNGPMMMPYTSKGKRKGASTDSDKKEKGVKLHILPSEHEGKNARFLESLRGKK
jgi:hypothetical protein